MRRSTPARRTARSCRSGRQGKSIATPLPSRYASRQSSAGVQAASAARKTAASRPGENLIATIIPMRLPAPHADTGPMAASAPSSSAPPGAAALSPQALAGLRVLDLSRVLAGPWCTQVLADLGADVIKVERPAGQGHPGGDDTRGWGPPFLKDEQGRETGEAAYYLGTNRNKRSITIDITTPAGSELVRTMAAQCDVFVENFKVGDMARRGLDAAS